MSKRKPDDISESKDVVKKAKVTDGGQKLVDLWGQRFMDPNSGRKYLRICSSIFGFLTPQDTARVVTLSQVTHKFLKSIGANNVIWKPLFRQLSRAFSDWLHSRVEAWSSGALNPTHGCILCEDAIRKEYRITIPSSPLLDAMGIPCYVCPGCAEGYKELTERRSEIYQVLCDWLEEARPLRRVDRHANDYSEDLLPGEIIRSSLKNWVLTGKSAW